ncbi:MAG: hypothetical protein AAF420_01915 [Pseudomonadota bacterium]
MKKLFLLLVLSAVVPQLQAKDFDGEHAVFGIGAENCETYLQARRSGAEASQPFTEWVFAYFSAFNVIVNNTYNIAGVRGSNEIMNWLDNYCGGSRRTLFVAAVADLTQRLYPQRANISPNSNNKEKWQTLINESPETTAQ